MRIPGRMPGACAACFCSCISKNHAAHMLQACDLYTAWDPHQSRRARPSWDLCCVYSYLLSSLMSDVVTLSRAVPHGALPRYPGYSRSNDHGTRRAHPAGNPRSQDPLPPLARGGACPCSRGTPEVKIGGGRSGKAPR